MLFDFAIYNPVESVSSTMVRACTVSVGKEQSLTANDLEQKDKPSETLNKRASQSTCLTSSAKESRKSFQLVRQDSTTDDVDTLLGMLEGLSKRFQLESSCGTSVFFSYSNRTIASVNARSAFRKDSLSSALNSVMPSVRADGVSDSIIAQLCTDDRNSNHIFGITIDATGDLAQVQKTFVSWDEGKCISGLETSSGKALKNLKIWERLDWEKATNSNSTGRAREAITKNLHARGECRTETVWGGDDCGSMAVRCNITPADFTKCNPEPDFCSTLVEEQRVCCSEGVMPDIRPQPLADGGYNPYLFKPDDHCSKIAARNGLTINDLEGFNKKTTWGWVGCKYLPHSINICLSTGTPPLPAPISNAQCGPLKPGSKAPKPGTELKNINPCPLNTCCNIWGQCGISDDFCIEKPGPTGNPGTSSPGEFGCVSSCGMDIVKNETGPGAFGRVGYYESWNFERSCLNLRVANANTDGTYTIIHWSFVEINTADWSVKLVDPYRQWEDFKAMTGVKSVITFGGWGYSTLPGTYDILRQAMSPANRDTFGNQVATFLKNEGLDGVDFDWEYPGAEDIPGTPPGTPSDGANYLKFLTTMKDKFLKDPEIKSLSIAAPASFWYLKAFPIGKMAAVLDYIVYMTYDLHGQWDVSGRYSIEGCPTGDCLQSHVNITETQIALSMITKAGVPTNKIYVGESSYRRSFKMAVAGCDGSNCKFLGDRLNSPAEKGRCTNTSGYISNAEINEIILFGDVTKHLHNHASNSDILVYNNVEWVAYMSTTTKDTRREFWEGKNFGGTIDWAVDLQQFTDDDMYGPDNLRPEMPTPKPLAECTQTFNPLEEVPRDLPDHCKNIYILQVLNKVLDDALAQYDGLMGVGYDKKFNTYAEAVAQGGNKQVEKFMYTKGNVYFSCVVTERYTCCEACEFWAKTEKQCMYCENFDCGWASSCAGGINNEGLPCEVEFRFRDVPGPCPPDYSKRSEKAPGSDNYLYPISAVTWKFRDGMEAGFWAALLLDTGITQQDVSWNDIQSSECAITEPNCSKLGYDYNFPTAASFTKEDVVNLKDVIENARRELNTLSPDLGAVIEQLKVVSFQGSAFDLVDALSLPISMIDDSVNSMQQIDDTVDEWDDEKRKNTLMAFLSVIFLVVPILSQVAGTVASLAKIARVLIMAGTAGNVALGIHSIVDDPDNAALAIFGLVLEPLAIFDLAKVSRAANVRRGMSPEDVSKLAAKSSGRLKAIEDVQNLCPLRKTKRDFPALSMLSLMGIDSDFDYSLDYAVMDGISASGYESTCEDI